MAVEYSPELNAKKTAISAFLTSLVASAKTAGLYAAGHPTIMAIADRVRELLVRTLGQETNLVLDIKAKSVLVEESELPETAETVAFAAALHTLGVGQLLFTSRMTKEGMYDFFKVLIAKPDEKTSLTDLQKQVQSLRIDGLQMVFILCFVVTGEQEQKDQTPGKLSEEQIQAFIAAETLPDFLSLLLKQNEELTSKEAETINNLIDGLLYRDCSLEKFEQGMLWSFYDPRIRQRFEELRAALAWEPKYKDGRRSSRPRWSQAALVSWSAVMDNREMEARQDHHTLEKRDALHHGLASLHALLDDLAWEKRLKYVILAYGRVLGEFGRDGDIQSLLVEYERWKLMGAKHELAASFALLQEEIRKKLLIPAVAEQFVAAVGKTPESNIDAQAHFVEFSLFLGEAFLPLLMEQMRNTADKDSRRKLCALLVGVCRSVGDKILVSALKDQDWFMATQAVGMLQDLGRPENSVHVAPLLKHKHHKVREVALRFLAKFGGQSAVDAMAEYIANGHEPEETGKAVIALSLLNIPGIDAKLVDAFRKTKVYQTKVAIVRALGRFPSEETVKLLAETARRSWYEILSGFNKELRQAARESLETLRQEGKA